MGQKIKKVMESWDIMLHGIEVIDRVSFKNMFERCNDIFDHLVHSCISR